MQNIFSIFDFLTLIWTTLLSWLIIKIILPKLSQILKSKPCERSSHTQETPTGGGISLCIVGSLGCALNNIYMPLYCLPLAFVGLIDDRINLSRNVRLTAQILTVSLLYKEFFVGNYLNELNIFPKVFFLVIIFIGSLSIINFTNFMDGIDGIIAGSFSIIFIHSFILNNFGLLPIIGSLFGFIIWNWSPAKIFMGDMGSTFIGAIFVGILMQSDLSQIFSLVLVSSPLFIDAIVCLIRRYLKGENIFDSHKTHLYQRLFQNGWSHSKVALNYIFCSILISCSWFIGGLKMQFILSLFMMTYGFWLDRKKAFPF